MGDAGLSRRFVGRADPVPDHMDDRRGAVIFDDDDFQAIVQPEVGDFGGLQWQGEAKDDGRQNSKYSAHERSSPIGFPLELRAAAPVFKRF